MNLLKTESGEVSKLNVANILILLAGLWNIFQPFVPPEYVPMIVAGIAAINLVLNTLYPQTTPIKGFMGRARKG